MSLFAQIDFSITTNRPDEFTELETPVDALYFALTVLSVQMPARRLADRASRSDHRRTPAPTDESQ